MSFMYWINQLDHILATFEVSSVQQILSSSEQNSFLFMVYWIMKQEVFFFVFYLVVVVFFVLGVICKNIDMEWETCERQYVQNNCDHLKNLNYDNQLAGKI